MRVAFLCLYILLHSYLSNFTEGIANICKVFAVVLALLRGKTSVLAVNHFSFNSPTAPVVC